MLNDIESRAKALLDYLYAIIRLGQRIYRNLEDHEDLILYIKDIPNEDGIAFFEAGDNTTAWLTVRRQVIPPMPIVPAVLEGWLEVEEDPDKIPIKLEERQIGEHSVKFDADERRTDAWDDFIEEWNAWADSVKSKKTVQDLFIKLFNLKERLKYDEDIELIWGQGIVLWKKDGCIIRYPLILQRMILNYDPIDGVIRLFPQENADPRLELDIFSEMNLPDLPGIREQFQKLEFNPADSNTYTDFLKLAGGLLSTDFIFYEKGLLSDFIPQDSLCIADEGVIFVRQRQVDSWLRDVEELKKRLEVGNVKQAGAWAALLGASDKKPLQVCNQKHRDEWSSLMDKTILFPLPANLEQIQIIDRLEQADGVVVWGPPGTGKSHTIANLISHFMAHGKKVLVTSQKEQALKVLHHKIPQMLRPLCVSMLSDANDSQEQLNRAVSTIIEIVTQSNPAMLIEQIKQTEQQIEQYAQEISQIQKQMEQLACIQVRMIEYRNGEILLPSELAKRIKKEEEVHKWLDDMPDYAMEIAIKDGKEVVRIHAETPLTEQEMLELKQLHSSVVDYLDELSSYIPPMEQLANRAEFEDMVDGLRKLSAMEADIHEKLPDAVFIDETPDVIDEALQAVERAVELYDKLDVEWQRILLETMRRSDIDRQKIQQAASTLSQLGYKLREQYAKVDLLESINLGQTVPIEQLKSFVEEAVINVGNGKKPCSFWELNSRKKRALNEITINGKAPQNLNEWSAVDNFISLLLLIDEISAVWNSFAQNVGIAQVKTTEVQVQDARFLLQMIERLQETVDYESDYLPKACRCVKRAVSLSRVLSDEALRKLYEVLCIKKAQRQYNGAVSLLNAQRDVIRQSIKRDNPHPVLFEMLDCLNGLEDADSDSEQAIEVWTEKYERLRFIDGLRSDYERFMWLWNKLKLKAPRWATRWLVNGIDVDKLCPYNWEISWNSKALSHYLYDINFENRKMEDLEIKQDQIIKALRNAKERLIRDKTALGLITGTSESSLKALERWRLAVKKLGKGTGKWAWKRKRLVQKEMLQAKDAVPVWIMPLYRVSETVPADFGNFDVVIVDEASQCDIKGLLALARGKKVIIVGDPEQISPDAVGKSFGDVQRYIQQYLSALSIRDYLDLNTSLFDIAKITFASQGMLMLKEHFRCMPEIIEFSNRLCYNHKIVPLRNVLENQRLQPVLDHIFVHGGRRDDTQDINRLEAEAICERLKAMVHDPKYKGKTFGIISLTGSEQAKYIWNIMVRYLTPEEQESIQLRVGDAYAFQGDERDIILLSMVVSKDDAKRIVALTKDQYRQRFNVAVSRARDQLLLFHSVELEDLKENDLRYELLSYVQNNSIEYRKHKRGKELLESIFEEALYDQLVQRGYKVMPKVEVGDYRLDMVVEGENGRLAIECDGDQWYSADQWWQSRLRQRQMERTGWRIVRVWGSDFYLNPEGTMKSLISLLDRLDIKPANNSSVSKEVTERVSQKSLRDVITLDADWDVKVAAR